jgi:hypothetical protein
MWERFGLEKEGWDSHDLTEFLEDEWNYGYDFGGRDPYMNNGLYPGGWTHKDLSMGTPLFHTEKTASYYSKDFGAGNNMYFINNRVNGFHVGVEGWLNDLLFYRVKGTYTNNKGNYCREYGSCNVWDQSPDYFFLGGKNQFYTGLELNWQLKQKLPLTLTANLGCDFGELYNSCGGRLGVVYRWSVK